MLSSRLISPSKRNGSLPRFAFLLEPGAIRWALRRCSCTDFEDCDCFGPHPHLQINPLFMVPTTTKSDSFDLFVNDVSCSSVKISTFYGPLHEIAVNVENGFLFQIAPVWLLSCCFKKVFHYSRTFKLQKRQDWNINIEFTLFELIWKKNGLFNINAKISKISLIFHQSCYVFAIQLQKKRKMQQNMWYNQSFTELARLDEPSSFSRLELELGSIFNFCQKLGSSSARFFIFLNKSSTSLNEIFF